MIESKWVEINSQATSNLFKITDISLTTTIMVIMTLKLKEVNFLLHTQINSPWLNNCLQSYPIRNAIRFMSPLLISEADNISRRWWKYFMTRRLLMIMTRSTTKKKATVPANSCLISTVKVKKENSSNINFIKRDRTGPISKWMQLLTKILRWWRIFRQVLNSLSSHLHTVVSSNKLLLLQK